METRVPSCATDSHYDHPRITAASIESFQPAGLAGGIAGSCSQIDKSFSNFRAEYNSNGFSACIIRAPARYECLTTIAMWTLPFAVLSSRRLSQNYFSPGGSASKTNKYEIQKNILST